MIWLRELLARTDVTDICVNGTGPAYFDCGNGMEAVGVATGIPPQMLEDELRNWVLDQLSQSGKTWDARHPFIDATLPSGHRMHVAFPPLARNGILISLRRLPDRSSCQGAARWGDSPFYKHLAQAVARGDSLILSGSTGSGKTTLATDLLGEVPESERIIALEDTPELSPRHPHFLSLISRPPNADGCGEVTLRTLLRQTLRMRPDRIILGECRGAEVLELLQALNTGHRGALATLHANSPREALKRIELLCLLASGGAIPLQAIRELLALGIQWIAQVRRQGPARKITEVWGIEGREGDIILMRPMVN